MSKNKAKKWNFISVQRRHEIQVLHSKGYSNTAISDITGLPEVVIARVLDVTRS